MKKLLIYKRDHNDKNVLLRSVRVTPDFIGIGNKGQINNEEFKKLALDLEPSATSHQIVNL